MECLVQSQQYRTKRLFAVGGCDSLVGVVDTCFTPLVFEPLLVLALGTDFFVEDRPWGRLVPSFAVRGVLPILFSRKKS